MKRQLFPCVLCKRHIREDEARCPFCAASPALLGLALLVGACGAEPRDSAPNPIETKPPIQESPRKDVIYGAPPVPDVSVIETLQPLSAPNTKPASAPVTLPVSTKKVEAKPKKNPIVKPDPRPIPAYGRPPTPIWKEPKPLYGSPAIPDYNRGIDDDDW